MGGASLTDSGRAASAEDGGNPHSGRWRRLAELAPMTSGGSTDGTDAAGAAAGQKRRLRQPFVYRRHHFTATGVLHYLFFLFAGAASTWLALLILRRKPVQCSWE